MKNENLKIQQLPVLHTIKNNFASNLKSLRQEYNIGQVELAKRIGVSKGIISLWENSLREPTLSYLIKIANFFNLTLDDLVNEWR